jgi:hypothetical protein
VALTERQIAAQKALQDAIEEQRRAFLAGTDTETAEVVSDWLLIAACMSYDSDGNQYVCYHMAFPDDQMMDHRVKGLAQHAIDLMNHGERVYGEEGRSE